MSAVIVCNKGRRRSTDDQSSHNKMGVGVFVPVWGLMGTFLKEKQVEGETSGRWHYGIQREDGGTRRAGRDRREEVVIPLRRCGHTGLNNS